LEPGGGAGSERHSERVVPTCIERGAPNLRYLRGGNHFPLRVGAPGDFRLHVADRALTEIEVGFQLRYGEMLPFVGLPQKRTALKGTEGGGSPVQRSYCAVSAHVFHDNFPVRAHELGSPFLSAARPENATQQFSNSLASLPDCPNGFETVDYSFRLKIASNRPVTHATLDEVRGALGLFPLRQASSGQRNRPFDLAA